MVFMLMHRFTKNGQLKRISKTVKLSISICNLVFYVNVAECGKLQDINQNNFLSGGYHTVLQLFCIIVK